MFVYVYIRVCIYFLASWDHVLLLSCLCRGVVSIVSWDLCPCTNVGFHQLLGYVRVFLWSGCCFHLRLTMRMRIVYVYVCIYTCMRSCIFWPHGIVHQRWVMFRTVRVSLCRGVVSICVLDANAHLCICYIYIFHANRVFLASWDSPPTLGCC